jgi:hypothetical protein
MRCRNVASRASNRTKEMIVGAERFENIAQMAR